MVTQQLSEYIAGSSSASLPPEVAAKARHHILDTIAAMVSGSQLRPGRLAIKYARSQRGRRESTVVGGNLLVPAAVAALANGMHAHADETDDTHFASRTHPGCAIIPAALAMAEKENCSGKALLHSVAVGYDVSCRVSRALGLAHLGFHSTYSLCGTFGAAAAASSLASLNARQVSWALSYAAQQASGVLSWVRDGDHIEKAFDFGGMPARNGVTAAVFVQSGFTGVDDALEGEKNFLSAYSSAPSPQELVSGLGSRYEILETSIKRFPIGAPIQAAADALLLILERSGVKPEEVEKVIARLPSDGAAVVNDRHMPDINLQHILAVILLDGGLTFAAAHDFKKMRDKKVLAIKSRVELVPDEELMRSPIPRQGIVEVVTQSGERLREHVTSVRGTPQNPMTTEDVEKKALELLLLVLDEQRSRQVIEKIRALESLPSVRDLTGLLRSK
ncbi:MAG: MmgE/PrpD family protein [Deltaproteobacteria bacterium]|nr:MmgE/PrpD family protein [Deltaproteobacteria bacterium]